MVPQNRYNEALSFIKGGLIDLSLSRPRLKWGVPVPWDTEQVIYVWIDALLNYYSALSYAREGEDLTERFWPASVHLIGKDILKFHAVIWPAMLMAAGIEPPQRVAIHGYLLMGEHKMSKSLGNVLDPFQVIDLYGEDALRFYVLREVRFGQDGEVSPEGFEKRYTTELANEYGNLASRTLAMIERYREGVVPETDPDAGLAADFDGLAERVAGHIDDVEPTAALDEIWQRVKRLNQYVQDEEPWQLAKDDAQAARLDTVLFGLAEGLRVVSVLVQPFLPALGGAAARGARPRGPLAGGRPLRRGLRRRQARRARAALPEGRAPGRNARLGRAAVVDTHCHLDACEPPAAELVERARAAGVTRIATVGMNPTSILGALEMAEAHEEVFAIVGRHPHETEGFGEDDVTPIAAAAEHPRARAIGETGLDYYRDRAPREDQMRAFLLQLGLARAGGAAGRDPHARCRGGHVRGPARTRRGPDRGAALLLGAGSHRRVRRARLPLLVRGKCDLSEGDRSSGGGAGSPRRAAAGGDRLSLPRPAAVRGKPNEPANVRITAEAVAELRGVPYEELERTVEANAVRVFGWWDGA